MRCLRPPTFVAIMAVGVLSLLVAGCGGGTSPGVASVASSTSPRATASSAGASALVLAGRCLRQNGIPNLPDPTIASSGPAKGQPILDKQALQTVPTSVLNRAMLACHAALAHAGIGSGTSTRSPQQIRDGLAFARCVRNHGISNFPDPNAQGQFDLAGTGINPHALSPAELAAARTCLPAGHGAVHLPAQSTGASN